MSRVCQCVAHADDRASRLARSQRPLHANSLKIDDNRHGPPAGTFILCSRLVVARANPAVAALTLHITVAVVLEVQALKTAHAN